MASIANGVKAAVEGLVSNGDKPTAAGEPAQIQDHSKVQHFIGKLLVSIRAESCHFQLDAVLRVDMLNYSPFLFARSQEATRSRRQLLHQSLTLSGHEVDTLSSPR